MKIEKINDRQIRISLSSEDLRRQNIRLSALSYGTLEARHLFQDMLHLAKSQCDFDAENLPLMIEAVPMRGDCLDLIITKVTDPDELDTRFSRFSPALLEEAEREAEAFGGDDFEADEALKDVDFKELEYLADFMRAFDAADAACDDAVSFQKIKEAASSTEESYLFTFISMADFMDAAALTAHRYQGESFLYKDKQSCVYHLLLQPVKNDEAFRHLCNTLSEYGTFHVRPTRWVKARLSSCEMLLAPKALQDCGAQSLS